MTDPVFFSSSLTPESTDIVLDKAEMRHAQVKRMEDGESLILSNGRDYACHALWNSGRIECKESIPMGLPQIRVTIVQGLPKAERAELAVDLAVQAGADYIIPWQAGRCISRWDGKEEKARKKWENMALSATKQSRRVRIPPIADLAHSPTEILEIVNKMVGEENPRLLLALHESTTRLFAPTVSSFLEKVGDQPAEIIFVIGPEGGISEEELSELESLGAYPVVMGPEVLRTASAAAVALGAVGALSSRWAQRGRA